MEFLLQWADDLDDAVHALRHLLPNIVGFLVALALFAATGAALVLAPHVAVPVAGGVLSASLLEVTRRRRTRVAPQSDAA
jgi:hypothetical protein